MKKLILALMFFAASSQAAVYKCTVDGKLSFQDHPCEEGRQQLYSSTTPNQPASATTDDKSDQPQMRSNSMSDLSEQLEKDRKRRALKRKIKQADASIKRYYKKMATELDALKRKKARANNNLAGATWENSISNEMNAVTQKYTALIDNERIKQNELKSDLQGLK